MIVIKCMVHLVHRIRERSGSCSQVIFHFQGPFGGITYQIESPTYVYVAPDNIQFMYHETESQYLLVFSRPPIYLNEFEL